MSAGGASLVIRSGDPGAVIAQCTAFAASGHAGSIVILLGRPAPGLADLALHTADASLCAFVRQAALSWASQDLRVNAIRPGASDEDLARTIEAIDNLPSMTAQIIELK